jgi:hypothetical protein
VCTRRLYASGRRAVHAGAARLLQTLRILHIVQAEHLSTMADRMHTVAHVTETATSATRSRWQRIFLAVILVQLAAVLVLFHLLEGNYRALGIVKYAVIGSIFVASRLLPRPTPDHRWLAAAVAFLFLGDFFLIFVGTLPGVSPDLTWVKVGGMVGFFGGYLCLLAAYWRRVTWGRAEFLKLLPVLIALVPVAAVLLPHLEGTMRIWALVFTAFLSLMAWSALCTVHRGYYERTVALRFAAAGYLMFLSDLAVGLSFFYPGLHRNLPWLGTWIWITYIPAWALIVVNLSEPRLRMEPSASERPVIR